jgi:DNA-binding beta-propeller fold protein YncE
MKGGFDHAAVHERSGTLYVAHTANDALDLIDIHSDKYLRSIPGLQGVAGVLVSNGKDLIFTSNRGEKSIGIFHQGREDELVKVRVGGFPNGLAFDSSKKHLLAANVSRQDDPAPVTVSMVDSVKKVLTADIVVPGRTRWTVFDPKSNRFYVNISKPSQIVAVESVDPDGIAARFDIPATGPHGLDLDLEGSRLFCATDAGALFTVDLDSESVVRSVDLTGPPDVIFYNSSLKHLYVAIGDPGVIDVIDTMSMKRVEKVKTERGAHTIGYAREQNKVYAFLPETHRAAIFTDK